MPNRNNQIDMLRGIGIIAMILIHVTAWYKTDYLASHLWNISQFAVQIFIFCSGYLFFVKEWSRQTTFSLNYFGKRVVRLLIPYYVFLALYLPLEFVEAPQKINLTYILRSLTLTGGVDLNWVILLFLCLAVLMPLLLFLLRKHRLYFYMYVFLTVFAGLLFMTLEIRNYKFIFWLPWSFIILVSWFFVKANNRIVSLYLFLSSAVTTIMLSFYLSTQNHSLILFDNKYPPNLYFLLYGVAWISGIWFLLSFVDLKKKTWDTVRFFSTNSYSLYFIHFWIFTFMRVVMKTSLTWPVVFTIVIFSSVLVQKGVNYFVSTLKRGPTI